MSTPTTTTTTKPTGKTGAAGASQDNGKRRGRPPGSEAKVWDYTGLDATLLAAPQAVSQELASLAAPTRARDERQMAVDKIVAANHAKWEQALKPDKWSQMPKESYHVNPKAADTVRMLVRRAAAFYGISVKFGKPVRDTQGLEIVVFGTRDSRVRTPKGKASWSLDELREIATGFFDDAEDYNEFLTLLTGESESDENGDDEE